MKFKASDSSDGTVIAIKLIPKSKKNEIVGWEGDHLKIKISAIPKDGEANEALIKLLAKFFGVAKSSIKLISGHTSRQKKILVGLKIEEIQTILRKQGIDDQ